MEESAPSTVSGLNADEGTILGQLVDAMLRPAQDSGAGVAPVYLVDVVYSQNWSGKLEKSLFYRMVSQP